MTRRRGFTLIELMIVVAIIAILAAIAIPGLRRGKLAANETAAIGGLKTIVTGQSQFKQTQTIDLDNDGEGEFGYLQEMSGIGPCRSAGGLAGPVVTPPLVQSHFGIQARNNAGISDHEGYHYLVYLPGAAAALAESSPLPAGDPGAADFGENRWICYAWPTDFGGSGNRVFAVDNAGLVFQGTNVATAYDGTGTVPAAAAALDPGGPDPANLSARIASGGAGGDGQIWTPVGG